MPDSLYNSMELYIQLLQLVTEVITLQYNYTVIHHKCCCCDRALETHVLTHACTRELVMPLRKHACSIAIQQSNLELS